MSTLDTNFMPLVRDIYIDQGDTYSQILTITDKDGAVVDLTGWSPSCVLRKYFNSTTELPMGAIIYGNPFDGKINLSMTTTQTDALDHSRYVYSVKMTSGSNVVRVVTGQLLVSPE